MTRNWIASVALAATVAAAGLWAAPSAGAQDDDTSKTYYFGTHTKHTNITFVSEADVENIYGSSHAVSGQCVLDFDKGTGKCRLSVPVNTLKTGIDKRDEHLRGDVWLDAENHPTISFSSSDIKVKDAKKGVWAAKGKFKMRGSEKDLTADVRIKKIPAKFGKNLGKGEWIRITATFEVKLSDHGVTGHTNSQVAPKVNDTWSVKFTAFATSEKPKPKPKRK